MEDRIALVPSPALLKEYDLIGHDLPGLIVQAGQTELRRSFLYAMTALLIGGLISLSIVGGFVYLVMQGHGGYAGALLGAGALNMVAGFQTVRLNRSK
jgi:hypothetical protein